MQHLSLHHVCSRFLGMICAIPEKFAVQGKRFYAHFCKSTLLSIFCEVLKVKKSRLSVCDTMVSANKEFKAQSRRQIIAIAYVCTMMCRQRTFIVTQQDLMVLWMALLGLRGAGGQGEDGVGILLRSYVSEQGGCLWVDTAAVSGHCSSREHSSA